MLHIGDTHIKLYIFARVLFILKSEIVKNESRLTLIFFYFSFQTFSLVEMFVLKFTPLIILLINLKRFDCLPSGAPVSTCSTLMPVHSNIPPEATQSLFRIIPQASSVGQGQILRVEIPSDIQQLAFKGFIIHARTLSGRVVGRFAASADGLVKLINCDGAQNTATHSNTSPKVDFGLDWQAPTDYLGDIIFK